MEEEAGDGVGSAEAGCVDCGVYSVGVPCGGDVVVYLSYGAV